jgi:hypothetical protein
MLLPDVAVETGRNRVYRVCSASTLQPPAVVPQVPTPVLCPPCSIANPDNLALIPDQQILIIGEDTATHQVPLLRSFGRLLRAHPPPEPQWAAAPQTQAQSCALACGCFDCLVLMAPAGCQSAVHPACLALLTSSMT